MRRKPRVVIDTNVVVSALLWGGRPLQLLALAASGRSTIEHVADYRRLVTLTRRSLPTGAWLRDPDDDRVIACALAVRADFVVTGDDDLLALGKVEGLRIVSPAEFLNALA